MNPVQIRHPAVADWLREGRSAQFIWQALEDAGTLAFPALSSGLYSAALVQADGGDDPTGYGSAWLRDNVHIAYALHAVGRVDPAVRCAEALVKFYRTQAPRFEWSIRQRRPPLLPSERPHIRFDGERLVERPERWAHAQNDALGYLLWFLARLVMRGELVADRDTARVVADIVAYLAAIQYWRDADSGHWEEERKVCASSIGTVVAGLQAVADCRAQSDTIASGLGARGIGAEGLAALIARGTETLNAILPRESVDGALARGDDAALLFLIEPLRVVDVDGPVGQAILRQTTEKLLGEHGVRRYRGDSYWAPEFRRWQSSWGPSTADDYREARARLWVEDQEAQWALFDPTMCAIYARSHAPDAERRRNWHFRRTLGQLTGPNDAPGPLRCVEAYFVEDGDWVPNDHVPLLWTQANLLVALQAMVNAEARRADGALDAQPADP